MGTAPASFLRMGGGDGCEQKKPLAHVEGRGKPGASLSLALWGLGFAYLPVSVVSWRAGERQSFSERMEDEAGLHGGGAEHPMMMLWAQGRSYRERWGWVPGRTVWGKMESLTTVGI